MTLILLFEVAGLLLMRSRCRYRVDLDIGLVRHVSWNEPEAKSNIPQEYPCHHMILLHKINVHFAQQVGRLGGTQRKHGL